MARRPATLRKSKRPVRCRPGLAVSGEPDRIRTCDPLIKSQLLYQLSYRPVTGRVIRGACRDGQAEKPLVARHSGGNGHAGVYARP